MTSSLASPPHTHGSVKENDIRRYNLSSSYQGAHCPPSALYDANLLFRCDPFRPAFERRWPFSRGCDILCGPSPSSSSSLSSSSSHTPIPEAPHAQAAPPRAGPSRAKRSKLYTYSEKYVRSLDIDKELPGHAGCVNSIHFDSLGQWLLSGSDDVTVCLYDTATWSLRQKYSTCHSANIFAASFMPYDCHSILTGALDGKIALMNTETGKSYLKCAQDGMSSSIACSPCWPHTAYVAYSHGYIARVDTRCEDGHGALLCNPYDTFITSVNALAMHERYPYTIASATNSAYVFLHDVRMGTMRPFAALDVIGSKNNSRGESDGVGGLSFSNRGDFLAVNYRSEDLFLVPWADSVRTHYHKAEVASTIGSNSDGGGAHQYRDVRLGALDGYQRIPLIHCPLRKRLIGRDNEMTMFKEVAFMEDDTVVCTGSDDGHVYFWRTADGALIHRTRGDREVVNGVLSHPTLRQLVSCGIDSTVKVFAPFAAVQSELAMYEERIDFAAITEATRSRAASLGENNAPHVQNDGTGRSDISALFREVLRLVNPNNASSEDDEGDTESDHDWSTVMSSSHSDDYDEGDSPTRAVEPVPSLLRSISALSQRHWPGLNAFSTDVISGPRLSVTVTEKMMHRMELQSVRIMALQQAHVSQDVLMSVLDLVERIEWSSGASEMYTFPPSNDADGESWDESYTDDSEGEEDENDAEWETASSSDFRSSGVDAQHNEDTPTIHQHEDASSNGEIPGVEEEEMEEEEEESSTGGVGDILLRHDIWELVAAFNDSVGNDDANNNDNPTSFRPRPTQAPAVLLDTAKHLKGLIRHMIQHWYITPDSSSSSCTTADVAPPPIPERVQYMKWSQCVFRSASRHTNDANFNAETYQAGVLASRSYAAGRRSRDLSDAHQRFRERADVVKSLLRILQVFLWNKAALLVDVRARRSYWKEVAWLQLHWVYYYMAIGDWSSAVMHCDYLDTWYEFADIVALGSASSAYLRNRLSTAAAADCPRRDKQEEGSAEQQDGTDDTVSQFMPVVSPFDEQQPPSASSSRKRDRDARSSIMSHSSSSNSSSGSSNNNNKSAAQPSGPRPATLSVVTWRPVPDIYGDVAEKEKIIWLPKLLVPLALKAKILHGALLDAILSKPMNSSSDHSARRHDADDEMHLLHGPHSADGIPRGRDPLTEMVILTCLYDQTREELSQRILTHPNRKVARAVVDMLSEC